MVPQLYKIRIENFQLLSDTTLIYSDPKNGEILKTNFNCLIFFFFTPSINLSSIVIFKINLRKNPLIIEKNFKNFVVSKLSKIETSGA